MSDFYSILPASLQPIMQDGLLDRSFEEPLAIMAMYDTLADVRPWAGEQGAQAIMTKRGMIPFATNPITGSDAPVGNYGFEQYRMLMDQYGLSIDTNMAVSAMTLASKWVEDNIALGENASLSLNDLARSNLYGAYGGGTTWVATNSTSSTTLVVADATGFSNAATLLAATTGNSEGLNSGQSTVLAPVSGSNPLSITVNGVANTVTGCNTGTNTLTLGTAISATAGQAVVAAQGAVQYRPNGRASANQLVAGDIATLALFQSAVTRLRAERVPTIGGAYTAHIAPETLEELFQDTAFQSAYRGLAPSPVYRDMALGRFLGIDWIINEDTPSNTNIGGLTYFRPIVAGQGCLIKGPFAEMGNLVSQQNMGGVCHITMINGIARILRAPLDRLGQVLTSTWSWIGGYSVGTDLLTDRGRPNTSLSSALFKRAVVVEHV